MAVRSPGFAKCKSWIVWLERGGASSILANEDLVNWASLLISAWVHPDLKPPVLGLLPTKLFPSIANDGGANKEGRDAGRKNSHCTTSVFTAYEIIVLEL